MGKDCHCVHGGYLTCNDNYNPHSLQNRKWENDFPVDKWSFGFNRLTTLANYRTIEEILEELISTVR